MAGQDYKRHIPAGGSTRINANGETYIFCKFSDRDVTVDIAGRKVVMRTGSYMEFAPLRGENSAVTIYNEDTENPAAVLFVLGVGTYDEKLVRGEISVEPILRNADGTTKPDTRSQLEIKLNPWKLTVSQYNELDLIGEVDAGDIAGFQPAGIFTAENGNIGIYYQTFSSPRDVWVRVFDRTTLEKTDELKIDANYTSSPSGVTYWPGFGYVAMNQSVIKNQAGQVLFDLNDLGKGGFTGLTYDPVEDLLLLKQYLKEKLFWINSAGEIVKTLDTVGATQQTKTEIAVDYWTGNIITQSSAQLWIFNRSGELVENKAWIGEGKNTDFGYVVYRDRIAISNDSKDDSIIEKLALNDFETKPIFKATRQDCSGIQSVFNSSDEPEITADILAETRQTGVKVSGEIIKAALEYYFGRKVEAGYLDNIYRIELSNNGQNQPFRPVTTGNSTFARYGIEDDFTFTTPGTIKLLVDNELKLGEAL